MNDLWTKLWPALEPFAPLISAVIVAAAAVGVRFALVAINRLVVHRIVTDARKKATSSDPVIVAQKNPSNPRIVQRTRTMGTVLDNFVTWVVAGVALIIIMQLLGIPIAAVLASAGIIGAALAFGAQNIIKDVISGFLMVLEDQLGVGDKVDLGLAVGTVEAVGVRITTLRDEHGVIWFVRNGEILRVGNFSYEATKGAPRRVASAKKGPQKSAPDLSRAL
jgi:small conductance mechanosensitive channel